VRATLKKDGSGLDLECIPNEEPALVE